MRLRHIEIFQAIRQTGSVSAAAQLLHVSQPAVTKVLQHAELQLGFPLFLRVRGKLQPTPEALALESEVEKVTESLQGVRRLAKSLRRAPGQSVRVGAIPALALSLLPPAILEWKRDYPDIAERARSVRSPFERGRVEALLGTTCVIRGDRAAGRRHLHSARSLFDDAGADAWRDSIARRLGRLGEQIERLAGLDTVPIPVAAVDPLAACRAAWAPLLTERELQVAMMVVDGAPNREIADVLGLSVRTIEVHLGRVFVKLDVRGRVELTVLAHRTDQHV